MPRASVVQMSSIGKEQILSEKDSILQELNEDDFNRCLQFCEVVTERANLNFLLNICFKEVSSSFEQYSKFYNASRSENAKSPKIDRMCWYFWRFPCRYFFPFHDPSASLNRLDSRSLWLSLYRFRSHWYGSFHQNSACHSF